MKYRPLLLALFVATAPFGTLLAETAQPPAKKVKAASARKVSTKATKAAKPARAPVRQGTPYAGHEAAMQFADEVAARHGMDPDWARRMVGQAQKLEVVQRLIQPPPPGTRKNWAVYRSRFIDATRIAAGVRFWRDNREALERAEKAYGVPAEHIVGIIGVETIYGQQMGDFRVLDALATLAFDHPTAHPRAAERSAYFRGELEQLLAIAHRAGGDPAVPLGSFAGAMGLPQFMPSSWVRWAVDFDGDGRIDLRRSPADAIGSVASYFKAHGWQTGMPAWYPVQLASSPADLEALLVPDILPTFSVASFTGKGAQLEGAALTHTGPLALVELQNGEAPSTYVAGTENFYVITRYNQSSYYAMAVLDLGREVREAMAAAPEPAKPATVRARQP